MILEMTPGPAKAGRPHGPWYLCVRCWADGIRTKTAPANERPPVLVSPEMADALEKSNWKVSDRVGDEKVRKTRKSKSR